MILEAIRIHEIAQQRGDSGVEPKLQEHLGTPLELKLVFCDTSQEKLEKMLKSLKQ